MGFHLVMLQLRSLVQSLLLLGRVSSTLVVAIVFNRLQVLNVMPPWKVLNLKTNQSLGLKE